MWPFKKKKCNCEIATAYRLVAWWDDMKPEYKSISPCPLRLLVQKWRLKNWWKHMKPDWETIHPKKDLNIPTSWYILPCGDYTAGAPGRWSGYITVTYI